MSSSAASAVILVNLGTPTAPTPGAVASFLAEFLSDRRVVELPALLWQPILRGIVIPLRRKRVAHAYAAIWDGDSPLRLITQAQCAALAALLRERHGDAAPRVLHAMSYQGPSIAAQMRACREQGIERILLLPLYPQYSATTTATVYDQCGRFTQGERALPHLRIVRDYHDHPAYIAALAAGVRAQWERQGRGEHLLMSFHGIPEVNVTRGDPYAAQCERTAKLLAAELGLEASAWTLAYQSRFGRQRWLQPYTVDVLAALGARGLGTLDVICPAFAADCLETLEEMGIANRELFQQAGGGEYRLVPCLNSHPAHIALLAALVEENGFRPCP